MKKLTSNELYQVIGGLGADGDTTISADAELDSKSEGVAEVADDHVDFTANNVESQLDQPV